MTRWLVFSDGLDIKKAVEIANHFRGRALVSFGIGTNFTNDIPGSKALNIVIKIAHLRWHPGRKTQRRPD